MIDDKITLIGKIEFEPEDKTRKHKEQASWKKMAMVLIDGDVTEYYSWFIEKRYNLILNKPLRGAHISFINDSIKDMSRNGQLTTKQVNEQWNNVKKKWDGKKIPVVINLDPRTDDRTWWFNIPHDERELLQGIRNELGLGKPYWGMHMSLGYANEKNIEHSTYIHRLIKKGLITT
jgi:hypothetical protein